MTPFITPHPTFTRLLCIIMPSDRPTCWKAVLPMMGGQRLSHCIIILLVVGTQACVGQLPLLRSCGMHLGPSGSNAMEFIMPETIREHHIIWQALMPKSGFTSNRDPCIFPGGCSIYLIKTLRTCYICLSIIKNSDSPALLQHGQ